jgi:hypothetical protein
MSPRADRLRTKKSGEDEEIKIGLREEIDGGPSVGKPARVAELADAQDLGSCAARREGSSPSSRIPKIRWTSDEILATAARGLVRIW